MLSMSFFDLAYDAVNAIGFLKGNLWVSVLSKMFCKAFVPFLTFFILALQFFAGALLFSAIADIFPEPECSPPDENDKEV
uniref:Uncharacterized protein n=1 Tax=Aegilops tauschii subsp. strangulata TaxID=200361 RepID=A0A453S9Q6_AEGTS